MSRFSASRSGGHSQVDRACPKCNGRLAPGKWGVWCPAKCGWRNTDKTSFQKVESPTSFEPLATPSDEQVDIFKATKTSDQNMVIEALAGTGKTTVLTNQAYHFSRRGLKVLCLAFTSRDRWALHAKIPESVAKVWTSNAAGLSILSTFCRQNGRTFKVDPDGNLPKNLLKERFVGDDLIKQDGEWTPTAKSLFGAVLSLVGKARTTMALAAKPARAGSQTVDLPERPSDKDWGDLAERFGIEVKSDLWPHALTYASSLFRELADLRTLLKHGTMDHDGCVFLPVYHQLQPSVKYDRVLIDEGQDQSYVTRGVAELFRQEKTGRFSVVGDRNQAIYAWRGADQFAMHEAIKLLLSNGGKVDTYPLTECRRCATSIIGEAQKIVDLIRAIPAAPEGQVESLSEEDFLKDLVKERKGLVLCRQNAPVISLCLQLLSKSVPATIARSHVVSDIVTLIENAANGDGGDCPVVKVIEYVESWKLERIAKLSARTGTENQIQVVNDKAACIVALADCQGVRLAKDLLAKIEQIFPSGFKQPDSDKMVVFSTVHGAKGSECNTVYLYSPMNEKSKGSLWDAIWSDAVDRDNTLYVAITRAKTRLVYAGVPPTVARFAKESDMTPPEEGPVDNSYVMEQDDPLVQKSLVKADKPKAVKKDKKPAAKPAKKFVVKVIKEVKSKKKSK